MRHAHSGRSILNVLANRFVLPLYRRRLERFRAVLRNARRQQESWLLERVRKCADTQFGRAHHFREIRTLADFRQRVPVSGYSYFAPYIDAVARGEFNALFPSSEPVSRFTITTGSTGVPKLNPVTPTWFREYRESWDLWGLQMLVDHPGHLGGKIIQMPGTWNMGQTPGGIPISMVSTLMCRYQHPVIKKFQAVPLAVSDIADPLSRQYTILRLTVLEQISLIVQMNPGALVRLAEVGNEFRELLVRDIYDGTLSNRFEIPAAVRQQLRSHLRPNPGKGVALREIIETQGGLYPRDYWSAPIISCWLGGTAGFQSRYLARYFGASPLRDMGLVSSEGRHTIPLEDGLPQGVLAATANFYEFVPVEEIHSATPLALEGHELHEGRDYFMLMSTSSGYYRFNIGDIVRCHGFVGEAPLLEFLQKGDRCADLEGEKVTELQFIQAADKAAAELGLSPEYITAVPCRPRQEAPCYTVVVENRDLPTEQIAEQFLQRIDAELRGMNFLYRAKRAEQVLGPLRLLRLPDAGWSHYRAREIARRGTGDSQYKHPALVLDENWLLQFSLVENTNASARVA